MVFGWAWKRMSAFVEMFRIGYGILENIYIYIAVNTSYFSIGRVLPVGKLLILVYILHSEQSKQSIRLVCRLPLADSVW